MTDYDIHAETRVEELERQLAAARTATEELREAAMKLRNGLWLGPHQQVYIVGDHYAFTVEEFDKVVRGEKIDPQS